MQKQNRSTAQSLPPTSSKIVRVPEIGYAGAIFALLLGLSVGIIQGCSSAIPEARSTIATAAHILDTIDASAAPLYELTAANCLASSVTPEAYSACMSTLDAVESAEETALSSLMAAELAVDAWEAGTGSSADFLRMAGCATSSLAALFEVAMESGAHIPEGATSALHALELFGGSCEPPATDTGAR